MIRRAISIILLTLLVLMVTALSVTAITIQEAQPIKQEGEFICKLYNTKCDIIFVDNEYPYARTRLYGIINVSNSLVEMMNKDELRSVIYHEVGHRVLKHVEQIATLIDNPAISKREISEFRYKKELEADRFATLLVKYTKRKEGLSSALLKITPPEFIDKDSPTHPSTRLRIIKIRNIYYGK